MDPFIETRSPNCMSTEAGPASSRRASSAMTARQALIVVEHLTEVIRARRRLGTSARRDRKLITVSASKTTLTPALSFGRTVTCAPPVRRSVNPSNALHHLDRLVCF